MVEPNASGEREEGIDEDADVAFYSNVMEMCQCKGI